VNICACGCVQVGDYDVLLTFADHDAVEFFAKCGFNDDPILNSPFRPFLDDDWDQSILMSYYRPVAAEHGGRGWNIPRLVAATGEFAPLEQAASSPLADDIRAWRETRVRVWCAAGTSGAYAKRDNGSAVACCNARVPIVSTAKGVSRRKKTTVTAATAHTSIGSKDKYRFSM
jgi:hypothetical protein